MRRDNFSIVLRNLVQEKKNGHLNEKLGVPSGVLDFTDKVLDLYVDKFLTTKDFFNKFETLNSSIFSGKFKLSEPHELVDNVPINNITFLLKIDQVSSYFDVEKQPMYTDGIFFKDMATDVGNPKLVKKGDGYGVHDDVTKSLNLKITIGTKLNPQEVDLSSVRKLLRNNEPEISSTIAHEVKHMFDMSVKNTSLKDRATYISINELLIKGGYQGLARLFFYYYKATSIEKSVYMTEMAKLIQKSNVTKDEFADFLKSSLLYKNVSSMADITYEELIKSDLEHLKEMSDEIFPVRTEEEYRKVLNCEHGTDGYYCLLYVEDDMAVFFFEEIEQTLEGIYGDRDMAYKKTVEYFYNLDLHEELVLLLYMISIFRPIENLKIYLDDFVEPYLDDVRSRTKDNKKFKKISDELNKYSSDIIRQFKKDINIRNPKSLKISIQRLVKMINRVGKEYKKKLAKLYAYDELFVGSNQSTKLTEIMSTGKDKSEVKEVTLEDVVQVIRSGDKKAINEVSLSRVYQHFKRKVSDSFAILTAFRAENTKKENIEKNEELEKRIRSMGLGPFKVKGHWLECKDPNLEYNSCPDDMKVPVVEYSFFIPNITRKQAVKLAKKYYQDAFIYSGPETNDKVVSLSKTDKVLNNLGNFSPNTIAQGYSEIRGRTFTFEGFQYMPQGMLEGMAFL